MGRIEVAAPKYALLEFCNALRKYVIRAIMNEEDALKALNLLLEASITLIDIDKESLINALKYSLMNHVTVYDSYYIILAHNLNTELYTADEKLLSKLSNIEFRLKHIKEYRS
ncbi:MAG: VapC toxin family PIN domain ribonuclease [Desulfurococcales archaeon ex4484_42]|nr:MAG: VapC toxin family PIN domain ribonuclease [Desulfurococcales archaeon ex4484_42]